MFERSANLKLATVAANVRRAIAWGTCALLFAPAMPLACGATLQELLDGAHIDVGGSRFHDWQLVGLDSTATPGPNLAQIVVLPLVDDLLQPGLQFLSNGPLAATGINSIDAVLNYRVEVFAGGRTLIGQSLELPGVNFGGGSGIAHVSQEAVNPQGVELASSVVIADKGSNHFQLQSAAAFAPRLSLLATANIFVTGLSNTDTVNLTKFHVRVAQSGPLALPGDFDGDRDVDAADFAKWKSDFGVNGHSDGNSDGVSDGSDFLLWQQNFGTTPLAATSAPEPASGALLCSALLAALAARRRRRPRACFVRCSAPSVSAAWSTRLAQPTIAPQFRIAG